MKTLSNQEHAVLGRSFTLSSLATRCTGKRDRECLFRLAKEASIAAQDFESALVLRALQSANRPRLRKGYRHAPQR